jgi:hypothetical protein
MKRRPWTLFFCVLTGCSTHPLVDLCDHVRPGRLYPNQVLPYGGVAIPQGPIIPAAPNISVGPPAPLPIGAPVPGVVPPPVPLPGNTPPPAFPFGDAPPPFPPDPPRPRP